MARAMPTLWLQDRTRGNNKPHWLEAIRCGKSYIRRDNPHPSGVPYMATIQEQLQSYADTLSEIGRAHV